MNELKKISHEPAGELDFIELDSEPWLQMDNQGIVYIEHYHSTAMVGDSAIENYAMAQVEQDVLAPHGEEVTLTLRMPLGKILVFMTELHEDEEGKLPVEHKPLYDATRAELVALIEQIDQLRYK